jgi:hypothetical protein
VIGLSVQVAQFDHLNKLLAADYKAQEQATDDQKNQAAEKQRCFSELLHVAMCF